MISRGLELLSESTVARKLMTETPLRGMSRRFVAGETLDAALEAFAEANGSGLSATANYLGEAEHDRASAREAVEAYRTLLERIAELDLDSGISLKPTQLGAEIGAEFLEGQVASVLERARELDRFVRIDMESSKHTDATLRLLTRLRDRGFSRFGGVLQACLHRTENDVRALNEKGIGVRLCKGAYPEPEEIAYQDRDEIREAFLHCARLLLKGNEARSGSTEPAGAGDHPAFATHDDALIREIVALARELEAPASSFEFQMLHGVRRDLQQRLVSDGWKVRVYIPFGEAWYPYLVRRLAERPANVLLLMGSVIRESPLGVLWPDGRGNHRGLQGDR